MTKWGEMAELYATNQEWKHKHMQQLKKEKKMKANQHYDREIYMSEYVTIPKARLRRLIITEVVAWGISVFLLLISVLR